MLRLCRRNSRSLLRVSLLRTRARVLCSSSSFSNSHHENRPRPLLDSGNGHHVPSSIGSPLNPQHSLSPLPSSPSSPSRSRPLLAVAAAASVSAAATFYLLSSDNDNADTDSVYKPNDSQTGGRLQSTIEQTVARSSESARKIVNRMKQTGVAASVLWQSLWSVLSSANHEVRSGFEFRVASFLADIAAVNAGRRAAIVAAGGGKVVDWLLETVAAVEGNGNLNGSGGTQAEAARALAYLVADPVMRNEVFGRPHAVPYLLRFIFSSQPHHRAKKNSRRSSYDLSDSLKGRSMLVAAIMDVVTSNCESLERISFRPSLPAQAELRDIAAAIEVIEGGMNLEDPNANDDNDDGGSGLKGIGIKVLGGEATVVGLSRNSGVAEFTDTAFVEPVEQWNVPSNILHRRRQDRFLAEANLSSAVVPGLWDDLHSQHVAVPFAAWALANWAMASEENRIHIQELDRDGNAIMSALSAPERSVKWHASLVARMLLDDSNIQLSDSVSEWSTNLLLTTSQACKTNDISLAKVALSAFLLSVERSDEAKNVVMDKGLRVMKETAKQTTKHTSIQESLAKALELICVHKSHLSLEESQRWSSILLHWACGRFSSERLRLSATNILSHILEEYGPSSVPISQGWLTILLTEVLSSSETDSVKGKAQPKGGEVKAQVNQANIASGTQIANQLASAVVNLASSQSRKAGEAADEFAFADLLSREPFATPLKKISNEEDIRIHAADSALVTLKGIKALAEICADDLLSQNKIADSGVLCLLRRYLLRDDYEKLAAIETYDVSRLRETQGQVSNLPEDGASDPSSIQIPPTAHMRRHAARLLTILSSTPKVQKVIKADEIWCRWLEDCANGKIPGCNDLKIQSYARATLLNVFGSPMDSPSSRIVDDSGSGYGADSLKQGRARPQYDESMFLINPGSSHWKCPFKAPQNHWNFSLLEREEHFSKESSINDEVSDGEDRNMSNDARTTKGEESCSNTEVPPLDVIFIHGLRGGPFKTWRISEDKSSTKSGLVEKIDQEAGKQGTFWPGEWLSADFPHARLFSLKYKSNLTQWSGASLPLQEVSSMLLEKLVAAGIGDRPVVFVTHSMGGLVVKQMLHQAKMEKLDDFVKNTVGVAFYSCPHFGSKLADMPWRMGLVLRPAPTIGELRSGSPRLVELNDFMRHLHKKNFLEVLSFCETKVTPIVEGYGGWAFRLEIVPMESAYPGYGDLVVLESTDHINSCKPVNREDPSYTEILNFLCKLKARKLNGE